MKEVQDDRWIGKVKDLLEEYTPADAPGDWKQVRRKLNRNLSWSAWLLMLLRRPWMYTLIFGAGLLTGYFLFFQKDSPTVHPGANRLDQSNDPVAKPAGKPVTRTTLPAGVQPASRPHQTSVSESDDRSFVKPSKNIQAAENTAAVEPLILSRSMPDMNHDTLSLTGVANTNKDSAPGVKPRKPFDLPSLALKGDPWKVGLGYEYLAMIQPDTGKGYFKGLIIKFDKQVAPKLWLGTGLSMGKTGRERISKYLVRDWSKPDSAGIQYMRDSTVSYQKWQNHLAVPASLTYDLIRNRNFALPLSAGATFGFAYHPGHVFSNDGFTSSGSGGSTNGFTGFITLDLSVGYEVFYLRGLSAIVLASYRRMIAGSKSYGFGENFIGGKIVVNLDFDRGKW